MDDKLKKLYALYRIADGLLDAYVTAQGFGLKAIYRDAYAAYDKLEEEIKFLREEIRKESA